MDNNYLGALMWGTALRKFVLSFAAFCHGQCWFIPCFVVFF
jgi:hypothetical protein